MAHDDDAPADRDELTRTVRATVTTRHVGSEVVEVRRVPVPGAAGQTAAVAVRRLRSCTDGRRRHTSTRRMASRTMVLDIFD